MDNSKFTGFISQVSWSSSGLKPDLVRIVKDAIIKHDLKRSKIRDRPIGDGNPMST